MPGEVAETVQLPDGSLATWISEAGEAAPGCVIAVDDRTRAKVALRQMRAGDTCVWTGDYHNGRQLMRAVRKRLRGRVGAVSTDLAERWREQRLATSREAQVLGRLVVVLESDGSVDLRRAPDTREAVEWAWGPWDGKRLVSLRTLIGALGSAGWRRKGLDVVGLTGSIAPHFGVFSPTRQAYVGLLDALGDVTGQTALDVGCGTGVLSFVLLQRGLARAVGTDVDLRAVRCAQANAERLGLADRFCAVPADLFVKETFDWVVFNAPWMPAAPATRLDRAIFDAGGQTLHRWLAGLSGHLRPGGQGALILSDLPERLGLRAEGELLERFAEAGLTVLDESSRPAGHGRAQNRSDPLHVARSAERLRLFRLMPTTGGDS